MRWHHRLGRFLSDALLPWTGALALHALVLLAITFSLGWRHQATPAVVAGGPKIEAIEAVVVDSAILDAKARPPPALERPPAPPPQAVREAQAREAERLRQLQVEREAVEQARREEQARLQQLEREAEQARARAEAQAREAQRLAEAEAEAERKRQAELEAKRKAEERERLAREEAERRKAAERRERERLEAERQREAEQMLLAALAEEEDRQAKVDAGLLAQYKAQVKQKVERNWARPPEAEAGLSCEVNVRQLRDGQVITVEFGSCNGNEAVKRSIEGAVNRASPLPPPPDPSLFDEYLVFIFEPE